MIIKRLKDIEHDREWRATFPLKVLNTSIEEALKNVSYPDSMEFISSEIVSYDISKNENVRTYIEFGNAPLIFLLDFKVTGYNKEEIIEKVKSEVKIEDDEITEVGVDRL